MAERREVKDQRDSVAREVDRLLKKLPGADPYLQGPPHPAPAPKQQPLALPGREPPTGREWVGVWGRVALGVVLGVLITQWPYSSACGFPLYAYLGAVAIVMLAGAWGSLASWKVRMGAAHVMSLIVVFWGIVLAAEQILPRIGYAAERAAWSCPAQAPQGR